MMNEIDLLKSEYKYFLIVAETLNLTRAVDQSGVQQTTLSKSLKKLESALGEKLFQRTARGMELTVAGQNLRLKLKAIEVALSDSSTAAVPKVLRLTAHPSLAMRYLAKGFSKLVRLYSEIDLEMILQSSSLGTREIIEGKVDLGVIANPTFHSDLIIKRLNTETLSLWGSKKREPADNLFYNPDMVGIQKILRKLKFRRMCQIRDYEVLAEVARLSHGFAILPDSIASEHRGLGKPLKKLSEVSICFVHRYDHPQRKLIREIAGIIFQEHLVG